MAGEKRSGDLTSGSVVRKMTAFALPILAGNLLQAVYNIVDMVIVGQFAGATGMTAVSTSGLVTNILLMFCSGLANGGAAYIGQLFGAGKMDEAKRVVGTLLSFLALLALGLTGVLLAAREPLLRLLNTPADSLDATRGYLTICLGGTLFIYVYNALYAALRGTGVSLEPMLFVAATTAENILLDLLFVGVLGRGAPGAAAATVVSQFTSMCLIIIFVKRRTALFDFRPASFRIDGALLRRLLRVGLPQAAQFASTNISFLLIGALVNAYGSAAAAAAGAATKVYTFGSLTGTSFMSAIVTLTAQNHPKREYGRILRGMLYGIAVSLAVDCAVVLLCECAPAAVFRLFTDEAGVAEVGVSYLRIFILCLLGESTMFCMFGVLTGSGYTNVTLVCALISSFVFRLTAAFLLSRHTALGFDGIAAAYLLGPPVGLAAAAWFFITGRWKRNRIRVG